MDVLSIIGISIISIGTFLLSFIPEKIIRKRLRVILGVFLISIGTILTTLSSNISGQKDHNEVIQKINETKTEIRKIIDTTENVKDKIRLLGIQSKFDNWANKFNKDKPNRIKQLELNEIETKLQNQKREYALNTKYKPYYDLFISNLKEAVSAYNASSSTDSIYLNNLFKFDNIFYDSTSLIACMIFSNKSFFKGISFYLGTKFNMSEEPKMYIDMIFDDDNNSSLKYRFFNTREIGSITFFECKDAFGFECRKEFLKELVGKYNINNFSGFSETLLKKIIEMGVLKSTVASKQQ